MTDTRQLGELILFATPEPGLTGPLEVAGRHLHREIARHPKVGPERARRACILAALTLRDLLLACGWRAAVQPCRLTIDQVAEDGAHVRQLMIGDPDEPHAPDSWNAHMVVLAHGLVIDPTLGQARRDAWPDLPEMIAAPQIDDQLLTRLGAGRTESRWTAIRDTDWLNAPDARSQRRQAALRRLRARLPRG